MDEKKVLNKLIFFISITISLISCENDKKIIDIENELIKISKNKVYLESNPFLLSLFNIDTSKEFTGIITSSYPNGKERYRIKYSQGLIDGESEYYYPNGNLQKKGTLRQYIENFNGVKTLSIYTWKYYDSIGNLTLIKNFNTDGLLNGLYEEYYEDGTLKTKGNYFRGKKTGEWNKYFNNLKTGVKNYIPKEKTYTKKVELNKGNLQDIVINKESGEVVSGILISDDKYSNKGPIYFTYQKIVKGIKNGEFKEYRDTLLVEDGLYKDNILILSNRYYENGKIESTTRFIENTEFPGISLKHGLFTEYHNNGELKLEGNYFKGKKRGKWYGNSRYRENYNDKGLLDGKYTYYNVDGTLEETGNYINGRKTGRWTFYGGRGWIYDEGYYKNNNLDGKWTSYFDNGKVESERYFKNNLKIGKWKYYNKKNGTVLRIEVYN